MTLSLKNIRKRSQMIKDCDRRLNVFKEKINHHEGRKRIELKKHTENFIYLCEAIEDESMSKQDAIKSASDRRLEVKEEMSWVSDCIDYYQEYIRLKQLHIESKQEAIPFFKSVIEEGEDLYEYLDYMTMLNQKQRNVLVTGMTDIELIGLEVALEEDQKAKEKAESQLAALKESYQTLNNIYATYNNIIGS